MPLWYLRSACTRGDAFGVYPPEVYEGFWSRFSEKGKSRADSRIRGLGNSKAGVQRLGRWASLRQRSAGRVRGKGQDNKYAREIRCSPQRNARAASERAR